MLITKPRILLVGLFCVHTVAVADAIPDPCAGDSPLQSLVDRPSKLNSACSVPFKQAILEMGYQYMNMRGTDFAQNYPEAELRIGLPLNNEFAVLLPNYNDQSATPHTGFSPTVIGFKHEIGYTTQWLAAVETLVALPTGGAAFGSNKFQPVVNGIIQHSLNPELSVTFMLGAGPQTTPVSAGGQSYFSVNPDMVVSWQATNKLQVYGEIYGQSHTGPGQDFGFNSDAGVQYLLTHNIIVDAELGQRISGDLGGFNNYIGCGIAFLYS